MSAELWSLVDALGEEGLNRLSSVLREHSRGVGREAFSRYVRDAVGSPRGGWDGVSRAVFDHVDADAAGRVSWDKFSQCLVNAALHGGGHALTAQHDYQPVPAPQVPALASSRYAFCPRFGAEGRFLVGVRASGPAAPGGVSVVHPVSWRPLITLPSHAMTDCAFLSSRSVLAVASSELNVVVYDTTRVVKNVGSWAALLRGGEDQGTRGRPFVPVSTEARRRVFGGAGRTRAQRSVVAAPLGSFVVQRVVRTPVPHLRMAADAGGHTLVSSDRNGAVYLWDTDVTRPLPSGEQGTAREFSSAVGSGLETSPAATTLAGLHDQMVTSLAFTSLTPITAHRLPGAVVPPEPFLLTGSLDQKARVVDLERIEPVHTIDTRESITAMVYVPTHRLLVTTGSGGDPRCWGFSMPRSAYTLRDARSPHVGAIVGLATPGDPHQVLSADEHGTVKVWDLRRCQCLQTLVHGGGGPHGGGRGPRSVASQLFHIPCNHRVVTFGSQPALYAHSGVSRRGWSHEVPVRGVSFAARIGCFVTWTAADIRVWHGPSGRLLTSHPWAPRQRDGSEEITAVDASAADRWLVVGSSSGRIVFIDPRHGGVLRHAIIPKGADARAESRVDYLQYIVGLRVLIAVDSRSRYFRWNDIAQCSTLSLTHQQVLSASSAVVGCSLSAGLSTLCVCSQQECRALDPCVPDRGLLHTISASSVPTPVTEEPPNPHGVPVGTGGMAVLSAVVVLGDYPVVALCDVAGGLSLWSLKPYRVSGVHVSQSVCLCQERKMCGGSIVAASWHGPSLSLFVGDDAGWVLRLGMETLFVAANVGAAGSGDRVRYDVPAWAEEWERVRPPPVSSGQNVWALTSPPPLKAGTVSVLSQKALHSDAITCLTCLGNPDVVVTAARDCSVVIWTLDLRMRLGQLAMGRGLVPTLQVRQWFGTEAAEPDVIGQYRFPMQLAPHSSAKPAETYARVPPVPEGPLGTGAPAVPGVAGWYDPSHSGDVGEIAGEAAGARCWLLLRRRLDRRLASRVFQFFDTACTRRYSSPVKALSVGRSARAVLHTVVGRPVRKVDGQGSEAAVCVLAAVCASVVARRRRCRVSAQHAAATQRRAVSAAAVRPLAPSPSPLSYAASNKTVLWRSLPITPRPPPSPRLALPFEAPPPTCTLPELPADPRPRKRRFRMPGSVKRGQGPSQVQDDAQCSESDGSERAAESEREGVETESASSAQEPPEGPAVGDLPEQVAEAADAEVAAVAREATTECESAAPACEDAEEAAAAQETGAQQAVHGDEAVHDAVHEAAVQESMHEEAAAVQVAVHDAAEEEEAAVQQQDAAAPSEVAAQAEDGCDATRSAAHESELPQSEADAEADGEPTGDGWVPSTGQQRTDVATPRVAVRVVGGDDGEMSVRSARSHLSDSIWAYHRITTPVPWDRRRGCVPSRPRSAASARSGGVATPLPHWLAKDYRQVRPAGTVRKRHFRPRRGALAHAPVPPPPRERARRGQSLVVADATSARPDFRPRPDRCWPKTAELSTGLGLVSIPSASRSAPGTAGTATGWRLLRSDDEPSAVVTAVAPQQAPPPNYPVPRRSFMH